MNASASIYACKKTFAPLIFGFDVTCNHINILIIYTINILNILMGIYLNFSFLNFHFNRKFLHKILLLILIWIQCELSNTLNCLNDLNCTYPGYLSHHVHYLQRFLLQCYLFLKRAVVVLMRSKITISSEAENRMNNLRE